MSTMKLAHKTYFALLAILTDFLALHGYTSVPHHECVDGTDFNQ
jgi:hypothetical protein